MLYTTLAPAEGNVTHPAQVAFQIHAIDDRSNARNTGEALRDFFKDTDLDPVAEAVESLAKTAEDEGDASEPETEVEAAPTAANAVSLPTAAFDRGFRTGPVYVYESVPRDFALGLVPAPRFVAAEAVAVAQVVGIIIRVTPVVLGAIGSMLATRSDQVLASFTGTKQVGPAGSEPQEFDVVADTAAHRASLQGRWEWRSVAARSIRRVPVVKAASEPAADDE